MDFIRDGPYFKLTNQSLSNTLFLAGGWVKSLKVLKLSNLLLPFFLFSTKLLLLLPVDLSRSPYQYLPTHASTEPVFKRHLTQKRRAYCEKIPSQHK